MARPLYKKVLLKLSGEALLGSQRFGIDPLACDKIAASVKELLELGTGVALVIGGGNIFRGVQGAAAKMERVSADLSGMLATVMNGIALEQAFLRLGLTPRLYSALSLTPHIAPYHLEEAREKLSAGSPLLLVGGTGSPFFTTDTAAALRALELQADILLKATKVNGIYNKDPLKHPDAVKFDEVTHEELMKHQIEVMDGAAFALCREHRLKIRVFDVFADGSLKKVVLGEPIGTLVT